MRPTLHQFRRPLLIGIVTLFSWLAPWHPAHADVSLDQPDFVSIVKTYRQPLASLTSDSQAQAFFASSLGAALNLKESPPIGQPGSKSQPQPGSAARQTEGQARTEWMGASLRLTGELAAWNLAASLREAADRGAPALQTLVQEERTQLRWLAETNRTGDHLPRAFHLAETLAALAPTGQPAQDSPGFSDYAAALDRATPLNGTDESWLTVAERAGAEGLNQRLRANLPPTVGEPDRDRFARTYFETRLKPVLTAHLIALAWRAEIEAERNSRETWLQLRTWRERQREARGLARLCGTWQWTVHNHQNHQDHKMVMVFDAPPPLSPQQPSPSQGAKPAKVVVLGEGVYLRWESAGGYQEDSLLFTGEGQRLEGSFVNSAGAWGSITGKRVAPCKN
ncbi:MAG: hypothetical protein KGO52_00385 [Nitrospirota bacterium]|nr:hypothetical protein [Nitrospirota bacterium]